MILIAVVVVICSSLKKKLGNVPIVLVPVVSKRSQSAPDPCWDMGELDVRQRQLAWAPRPKQEQQQTGEKWVKGKVRVQGWLTQMSRQKAMGMEVQWCFFVKSRFLNSLKFPKGCSPGWVLVWLHLFCQMGSWVWRTPLGSASTFHLLFVTDFA